MNAWYPTGRVVTAPYGTSEGDMYIWAEVFTGNDGKRYVQFPFDIPLM